MKKKISTVALIFLLSFSSFAQWTDYGTKLSTSDNVGIGTTNPNALLDIKHSGGINLYRATDSNGQYRWRVDQNFDMFFTSSNAVDIVKIGQDVSWFNSGNIGIGTTNPGNWKLAVNGNIRAKEIKVETGWSDFVFFSNYELPTLKEVEKHIKEKGHLKDIPSAKEVAQNGILLGEMNSKLLQKIEELTLYTISQQKEIQEQKEKVEKQAKQIESLELLMERLTKIEEQLKTEKHKKNGL